MEKEINKSKNENEEDEEGEDVKRTATRVAESEAQAYKLLADHYLDRKADTNEEAEDNAERALANYTKSLAIYMKLLREPKHTDQDHHQQIVVSVLHEHIATCHERCARHELALRHHRQTLSTALPAHNCKDELYSKCYASQARCHMLMGHYADAVVYYDKCLEYSGDQNDDEPEFVMSVMKNEVTCYEQLKEWNKAAGLYAKMIQWWESKDANSKSVKQKSRAERADLLDRMAACYMQLGDYDEAVKCLERAYAKRKKHRPSHNNNSNNYKEWHTLFHLAECLRQLNKTSEALLVLAKCRKRIGGGKRSSKEKGEEGVSHHHPRMADTHNATGLTLFKKGEWKSALGEFEQALLIYRRVYSHNHKDVAAVVSNMGRCHDKLNAAASSSRPP